MRDKYTGKLKQLNNEMIEMGAMVEQAIGRAVSAFAEHDVNLAEAVIAADEEVNQKYKDIEGLCLKLLLHQQPVAGDLRQISSAIKMITDIERIGDHAADICELALIMPDKKQMKMPSHITDMTEETMIMLINSINAFVDRDQFGAERVIKHDDIVDDLFVQVKKELIDMIHADANNGEQAMDLLMIAKYLERIGDHATNIAEWVIFSITGER